MSAPAREEATGRFQAEDGTRAVIWAHLVTYPGLTAHEIRRAVLREQAGHSTIALCKNMQRDGQLTARSEYRAQQGRDVTCWYAVPGAFACRSAGDRVPDGV